MDLIMQFLGNDFFTSISQTIVGYLQDGVNFFDQQDILIQAAVIVGGVVIVFLGTIDLVKRLSKLIFVAVVLFALWFVYTNYVA